MKKQIVFISALFITTQASASLDMEQLLDMSLDQLVLVKITGSTLTPQSMKSVPSAVTSFNHKQIKHMGLDTLDELMNLVPGFQSYRSTTTAQHFPISSRGRRIGLTSSEILILVDGQRLDEPRTSGSGVMTPKYSLTNIERVEFIRGPGAAVYGSNAMMGVINIITRRDANEVSFSYGSLNRKQASVLSSGKVSNINIDFFAEFRADDGDTFNVQDTFNAPNRIETNDPLQLAELNLKLQWNRTQLNILHNRIGSENFFVLNGVSNNFNESNGQFDAVALKHSFDWQSVSSYLWLSYHQSNGNIKAQLTPAGALLAASGGASSAPLLIDNDLTDNNESRVQWHNNWKIDGKKQLQFGVEYRYIKSDTQITKNNFDLGDLVNLNFPIAYYGTLEPTTPIQNASSRNILGIYSQYQHQLTLSTQLTLGLRYDDFSNIDTSLSPRFALVHALNEQHSIKLLYAEAFRAPSENELNLINNPVTLGNPALKAETVESWDLIWVAKWSSTSLTMGYFKNYFDNAIVLEPTGVGAVQQFQNIDQKSSEGIELEVSQEFNQHWLLQATYTSILNNTESSFREAENLASIMLNYQQTKWNANLIGSYIGTREMPINGNSGTRISLDGYWQVFAKASYQINSDINVYVQAKNLLDENYLTPTSNAVLTEGVPNRGRELLLGLNWMF